MIYVVTNRKLVKEGDFYSVINRCILGGAKKIILREKDLSSVELLKIAVKIKKITDKFNGKLIINNNIQVSQEVNGYGCQLSYKKFIDIYKTRGEKYLKNLNLKIGVSIHSENEAINVEKFGGDYIIAGHIFKTKCKEGIKPRGVQFIKNIKNKINIPIIAIGGIKDENIREVIKFGASGVAIMSSAMGDNNLNIIHSLIKNFK